MTAEKDIQKKKGHFRKNWIYYVLLIAAAVVYFTYSVDYGTVKQSKTFEEEKAMLIQEAQLSLNEQANQFVHVMMKPLVWIVQQELMQGNMDKIDDYFLQLVKTENILEILLVNEEGIVNFSTNKKNQNELFSKQYDKDASLVQELTIFDTKEMKLITSPIISGDARLSTLVVVYQIPKFNY